MHQSTCFSKTLSGMEPFSSTHWVIPADIELIAKFPLRLFAQLDKFAAAYAGPDAR